jgi:tetratricopeptide (TPR) repeat protein
MYLRRFLSILFGFFLIIVFSCGSAKQVKDNDIQDVPALIYYKRALNFVESLQYEQALSQIDTAIILKPGYAQFYYAQGQILELMKKNQEAIKSYETALIYKSFFPEAWRSLGYLYMSEKQYEKAVQVLTRLVESVPDSLNYEIMLAEAYLFDNRPSFALERMKYYERKGGISAEIYRIKGIAYYLMKNYGDAFQNLQLYIQNNSDSFSAAKYLGFTCIEIDELEKGISYLNRALNQKPDDPTIYAYRAKYFIKLGKYDTALDQYILALELDNQNVDILLDFAKFRLTQADTTTAEKLLNQAVIANTNCWECFKYLGIIADEQGRDFDAFLYLQKYLTNIHHRDPEVEQRLSKLRKIEN